MAGLPEPANVEVFVVSKVTVPELLLNVPLFVISFAIVKDEDGGAVKVPLAAIINDPFTSIVGLFVFAVTVTELEPLPIVRSLSTVIVCDAPLPRVKVGPEATAGRKLKL